MRKDRNFQSVRPRLKPLWVTSVESALKRNALTFALLPIRDIFDPKGMVAALAAKGYTVEQSGEAPGTGCRKALQ
ncbi:hypothetical protein [Massilia sp. IC2-476]|uniref:hypothetical protein n=1 Tax=Massilia sp. IC2-476 TaxID=2887199 RepID=UPI001D1023B3|nr:hypothetical protein [Massilia sp. IC2-476]MCC2973424.1 hypothetical protein [Massilia sp. IC2-476]